MAGTPIHVLLVEDNPTDILLVRSILQHHPPDTFVLSSTPRLASAIELARQAPCDVILLDLGLPDSQGYPTFEKLHRSVPDVPVIVLSGLGDDQLALQAVQHGGQDYLPKGDSLDSLLPRSIRYAIERHRTRRDLESHAAELRRRNDALEEELRMAREIQQALLPHHYPEFLVHQQNALKFAHCYRPAASLSGDFFSVMRLSDHQAGVLICDVMGHGVHAALIGALARGLIDQSIPHALDPGAFFDAINGQLHATLRQADIDAFVTAFYLVVDLDRHQLRYANAGHPNPLVLRRDTRLVESLAGRDPHSTPLGLRFPSPYPTFTAELSIHDAVVLFTDGLLEMENHAGEAFGRDRLRETAERSMHTPCWRLLDDLVDSCRRFSGEQEFHDDVCLVGMDVVKLDGRQAP